MLAGWPDFANDAGAIALGIWREASEFCHVFQNRVPTEVCPPIAQLYRVALWPPFCLWPHIPPEPSLTQCQSSNMQFQRPKFHVQTPQIQTDVKIWNLNAKSESEIQANASAKIPYQKSMALQNSKYKPDSQEEWPGYLRKCAFMEDTRRYNS